MFRKLFLAVAALVGATAVGYAQQPFPGDSARTLICGMPYLQNMTPDGVSVMFQSTCSVHSWVEVGRDTDSEDVALVEVSPKEQGEYKIEIKAYKFKEGYNVGHYGLIIAHE